MIRYARREDLEQINEIRWEINDCTAPAAPIFFETITAKSLRNAP